MLFSKKTRELCTGIPSHTLNLYDISKAGPSTNDIRTQRVLDDLCRSISA